VTRKIALVAFAIAAITAVGFGLNTRGASAAPGLAAYAGGPYSGWAGNAIQFDGSASAGIGLSYFWTFGDGTSAVGPRPVKAYATSNVYTVTLTVTDYTGAQAVAATTATIGGARAVVPAGCFVNAFGNVVCGTTVSTNIVGCYATVAGWVCPGTSLAVSPVFAPGVVVAAPVLTATHLNNCNNPNYALTPACLDKR
jgi:hypothetical protein